MEGVLRIQGRLRPGIAIVGARRADPQGLELTRAIAREVIARDLAVISGGAFGVDIAAHKSALEAQSATLIILGSGLDQASPRSHHRIFETALKRGALISPFPCGQQARPWTFPRRNPWIAALAQAIIVVQAGLKSGSLHTARAALKMGRPVWVVPGPMEHPLHQGCHRLVEEGARLLTGPAAWTEEEPLSETPVTQPPQDCALLWRVCDAQPRTLEVLAERAGLSLQETMSQATRLELEGLLKPMPGGRLRRRT